jgi:hypothetical protein
LCETPIIGGFRCGVNISAASISARRFHVVRSRNAFTQCVHVKRPHNASTQCAAFLFVESESFAQRVAQIVSLGVELRAVIADEQEMFGGAEG